MDSAAVPVSAPLETVPASLGKETALLIADAQNAFLHKDGSMSQLGLPIQRMQAVLPKLSELADTARKAGTPVFFLQMWVEGSDSAGIVFQHFPPLRDLKHCAADSWDAAFVDTLQPQPTDIVIRHKRFSAFQTPDLESRLNDLGIKRLILAGFATNTVIDSTARSAFDRDLHVYIPRETTASYTPEMEEASLLGLSVGIARVVPLGEVLKALQNPAPANETSTAD
jgi:ureidoacrylate peracid hydrolase